MQEYSGENKTGKVIKFLTVLHHKKEVEEESNRKEEKKEKEVREERSYDSIDKVMCLTQRTAQQGKSLTLTLEF